MDLSTITPKPGSFWLVVYEYRYNVIVVSPDGKGFFAPGQDPLWPLEEVQEWLKEIRYDGEFICPQCGLRQDNPNKPAIDF